AAGRRGDTLWRYLTLAPAAALFLLLTILPVLMLLALSVSYIMWSAGRAQWSWAGPHHYIELASDALFGIGVVNTAIFAIVAVTIELVLGFALALLTGQ